MGTTLAAATFAAEGSPLLFSEIRHLGGAVATSAGRERSSMGNRDGRFLLQMVGIAGPVHDGPAIRRHQELVKVALGRGLSGRTYLNVLDGAERRAAAATSIDAVDLRAIAELRDAVDPDDLLRYGVDHGRTGH